MDKQTPNIFQYADYRQFIKDLIETKKKINAKFSYRYYSARAGFSSSNFISMVVKGKRNLTSISIGKLAKGLGLNKQERSFFEDLVFMNQAATHEEKDHYYQRMLRARPFARLKQLDKSSYEYFSRWYNPVIREMVGYFPQPLDLDVVASRIMPEITPKQVAHAIDLLKTLGLIQEFAPGSFKKTDTALTTGSEARSILITNFHKQMAELADSAIDRIPSAQRDVSGIILSVNRNRMTQIKKKIETFQNELIEMATEDTNENSVVFVQIRAFPLTQIPEDS